VANNYFQFKQFTIHQDHCAMKITTDSCLFGSWVADQIKGRGPGAGTILDIGTGTGLLSLMLAQKTNSPVTSIEIDKDAFVQASENINASPWKEKITIVHTDIKKFVPPIFYDIIISNPPFYENEWPSENSKRNAAHHSSELMLADLVDIIVATLTPNGKFYLLLPYKRQEEMIKLFDQKQLTILQKILVRQTVDHSYFRMMIEGSLGRTADTITTGIAIKNKNNEYTAEFTTLLKDYYLYI